MNTLIKSIDKDVITINPVALMATSARTFTDELSKLLEIGAAYGHRENRVMSSVRWAMRKELSARVRKARNLISVSFGRGILAKDHELASKTAPMIRKLADWAEATYAQYDGHAEAIRAISEYDFDLHPFQRRTPVDFTINNEIQDDVDEWDASYSFEDEDDDTDAWLKEQELINDMAQSDLRNAKVHTSGAMGDEVRFTFTNITKEEWVDEMLDQTNDEWLEAASFGAWTAADIYVKQMKASVEWPRIVEHLEGDNKRFRLPAKSLPLASLLRRKMIDGKARLTRIDSQIEYLEMRINETDNDDAQIAIRAVSNAKTEEDLSEVRSDRVELEDMVELLDKHSTELYKLFDLTNLDTPISQYVTYTTFDPIVAITNRMRLMAKMNKQVIGPVFLAEAKNKAAYMLGKPTIDSFTTDEGVELWSITYTKGTTDALVTNANTISRLRYEQFKADERAHRTNKVKAALKLNGMKNKRPDSMEALDAAAESFLF